ncbi:hypothetical protein HW555_013782 [Spodoptera exigua]|uniref:Uncharacterized protein n=1 Tax=Spodoptera exigua TaxID=7107 RepID=A0A835G4Z6_SPOEX|nr:hypothetical protein HW555_013782 [Spodoptera exigua]
MLTRLSLSCARIFNSLQYLKLFNISCLLETWECKPTQLGMISSSRNTWYSKLCIAMKSGKTMRQVCYIIAMQTSGKLFKLGAVIDVFLLEKILKSSLRCCGNFEAFLNLGRIAKLVMLFKKGSFEDFMLGLQTSEILSLERKFTDLNLLNSKQEHFFEVDTQGINVLNILSGDEYNYRIISQSMAMEKTNIGGRTIQVQKIVWTLGRT